MTDVTPPPPPPPSEPADVAWLRPAADTSPPSASAASLAEHADDIMAEPPPTETASPGVVAKIVMKVKSLMKKKETVKPATPPSKPMLVKAKEMVCKLPDPTLLFVLQASVMLLLHLTYPAVLRTWPSRIIFPLLLVPTVGMTALWRRTKVVSVRDVPTFTSRAKPIPDAGRVVCLGESLRLREAKLVEREDELRAGQMKLEVLRKEIEGRLPPQVSIANLLDRENEAARANARR